VIAFERNDKNLALHRRHSSRNSEVIHAGIYYPLDSLKMRYCIRGRELMYQRCERLGIPHRKTQKVSFSVRTTLKADIG
jgi:2-hydroxyglutarate dehydrogenase